MSLLLPDFLNKLTATRLTISLGNNGIAIVLSTGFRKTLVDQRFIANTQSADWQSIVQLLDASLSQLKLTSNTVCTIVLSSDFVRYLILPAQPFSMNTAEKTAYIQATYHDIYGSAADGWQIKYHDAAPHENILAVAVDAQLMPALSQLAMQHKLKLHNVQPYLMAALNGLMPQVVCKNGYLVLLEQSKLLLIRLQNGKCQHLRTLAFNDDWQLDLQKAIARESALNENIIAVDKQLFIYAPAQKNTIINDIQGWKSQKIGLKTGLNYGLTNDIISPHYAMLEAVL